MRPLALVAPPSTIMAATVLVPTASEAIDPATTTTIREGGASHLARLSHRQTESVSSLLRDRSCATMVSERYRTPRLLGWMCAVSGR